MEKILITGGSGLVMSQFIDKYVRELDMLTPSVNELDITSARSIDGYFEQNPDITCIINAAAYTNLTEAQKQRGNTDAPCWKINVVGVQNLVDHLSSDIFFIQISTDYVFSGDSLDPGPYSEDRAVESDDRRLSVYGHSKAEAEKIVQEKFGPRMAIYRLISPVVKEYELKMDYLRAPLAYYEKNHELYPVFNDQQINITDVNEFCEALRKIAENRISGTFHAGSTDITTPFDIMIYLFDVVYGQHDMVRPSSVNEYIKTLDDPTRYHIFGGLLNEATRNKLGINYSTSREIIDRLYRH